MTAFIGIAIGVLMGSFLGATGMYLFIKENALDAVIEREAEQESNFIYKPSKRKIEGIEKPLAPNIEEDELPMPRRR